MNTQSPRDIVVQIGIGEHTPHTLARAYLNDHPTIEEMRFVDLSEERLCAVEATCRSLNEETGRRIKITTSQNAMDVLEDATMVVFAFAVSWPQSTMDDYATRYARLEKCLGLCHGATATLRYIEIAGGIPPETIDGIVAGANHFIWYLKLWSRQTGDDFYPELARILEGDMAEIRHSALALGQELRSVPGLPPQGCRRRQDQGQDRIEVGRK